MLQSELRFHHRCFLDSFDGGGGCYLSFLCPGGRHCTSLLGVKWGGVVLGSPVARQRDAGMPSKLGSFPHAGRLMSWVTVRLPSVEKVRRCRVGQRLYSIPT